MMTPAPALDCSSCGKTIAKRRAHYLLDDHRLICDRCLTSRKLHARLYPHCTTTWHDLYDHLESTATRAGAACILGVWP